MNQPTLTNRQVALQCAIEYSKKDININSYTIVSVAERFRKFLDEGIVEVDPNKIKSEQKSSVPYSGGWRPRIGNG